MSEQEYKDYLIRVDREIAQIFAIIDDEYMNLRNYNHSKFNFECNNDSALNAIMVWADEKLRKLYNEALAHGVEVEDLNELFEGTGI